MNSLRARLILGFSLVAVLPLALAMLLLEQRIRFTMHAQASEQLDRALEIAQLQLVEDASNLGVRLERLAEDAELKRMHLVEPEGGLGLRRLLEDRRFLLSLDYLAITDSSGRIVADASLAPLPGRERMSAEQLSLAPRTANADSAATTDADFEIALSRSGSFVLSASGLIRYEDQPAGRVLGGVLLDSLYLARLKSASGLELMLRDLRGHVVASTLQGPLAPLSRPADSSVARVRLNGGSYLTRESPLRIGATRGIPAARLTALASTATADDAIIVLRTTALALGGLGVLLAIVLGLVWSHSVSRPVVRLAGFSERISRGEFDEPLAMESMRELQTLVDALERMRTDLGLYRDRLRASERQAAYGQMARRVAHEIKNPLTPIALSVAGLQRSYAQGRDDFGSTLDEAVRTVNEEVHRLKSLLYEFGELGRFPPPRFEGFDLRDLLRDLGSLHMLDVEAERLVLDAPAGPVPVNADRDQLRRALLNLAQNALDATATATPPGRVLVSVAQEDAWARLRVSDDGPGLTEEQRTNLFVPGFTTKPRGSGLGLTLVERIVSDHGGTLEVESAPGKGTTFVLRLPRAPAPEN
jgi:signal transduction histidine kinase